MIIVRLKGGLGNQMFQYAAARHLAVKNGTCLKLDLSSFSRYPLRSYRLNHYNVAANPASSRELIRFGAGYRGKVRRTFRAVSGLLPRNNWQWIVDQDRYYDSSLMSLRGNVYLEGIWQSVKYFSEISSLIQQELTLKTQLSSETYRIAEKIKQSEAVSLHIRRGDYVTDTIVNKKHGLCGLDYYTRAMDLITQQTSNPYFFVFSDDFTWAKNNLSSRFPMLFVTHNGLQQDYEDLYLMTLCKHHIIANSTFSWWGAWLCRNDHKIVIAPQNWFQSVPDFSINDLIPFNWWIL